MSFRLSGFVRFAWRRRAGSCRRKIWACVSKTECRRRRGTSELFPEHLPRHEIIVDLDDDDEKEGLQRIGEDITETLHYRRPVLHVVRKIYAKYVRPAEPQAGVLQARRSGSLVSGDRYEP